MPVVLDWIAIHHVFFNHHSYFYFNATAVVSTTSPYYGLLHNIKLTNYFLSSVADYRFLV